MRIKRVLKIAGIVVVLCTVLTGSVYGAVLWRIHRGVQRYCAIAQEAHPHPGDDVSALVEFMKSDTHSFRERDLAVWTLGRLCDPKALTALESMYTGESCEHDKFLCQHELEKAIKRCGGTLRSTQKARH